VFKVGRPASGHHACNLLCTSITEHTGKVTAILVPPWFAVRAILRAAID
jgi:hypothetical protein